MANPQLENGYTRVANDLLEALYSLDISGNKMRILLFIIRHTYGYNRKTATLSLSFIANGLGIRRNHLQEHLKELESDSVIEIQRYSGIKPQEIGIQKDFEKWVFRKYGTVPENGNTTVPENGNTTVPENGNTTVPENGNKRKTKENTLKKTDKENSSKPKQESEKTETERIQYEKIVDSYNEICKSLPKVRKPVSEDRKKHIQARINAGYTVEDFTEAFKKTEASSFCRGEKSTGNHKNWKATFDWIITDKFLPRILEGAYDDKGVNTNGKTVYRDTGII